MFDDFLQVLLASYLRTLLLFCALVTIAVVCAKKESKLYKETPNNLGLFKVGIGVLNFNLYLIVDLVGESWRFLALKKRERVERTPLSRNQ